MEKYVRLKCQTAIEIGKQKVIYLDKLDKEIFFIGAPHVVLKIFNVFPNTIYSYRQENGVHLRFHTTTTTTYFRSFSAVTGFLSASDAFIYSN